jgi:putative Mn2+ efflux pump MntP
VARISKRRSEAILKAYEKWGWLTVTVVWALALLFAATLVLIALGTLIIYPFAGTEENTSVAMLVGGIVLVGFVVLGFTMRNRFPMKG